MVGILLSCWDGLFSGATLVSGRVGAIFRWKNQVEKSSQAYTWIQPIGHGPKTWPRLAEENSRKTCEKMEKIQDPQQTNGVLVANWAFHSSIAVHPSLPGKSTINRIFGFHIKAVLSDAGQIEQLWIEKRIVVETNTDTGSIHMSQGLNSLYWGWSSHL